MPIPPEVANLIERLNQELNEIEESAIIALNLVRARLLIFPENEILTQFFASLSNILFFVQLNRDRIQKLTERISLDDTPQERIQDTAEELGMILGRVLEVKINTIRLKTRLE